MQTINEQDFLLDEQGQKHKKTWLILWLKEWKTINWLRSSLLSTIIVSEIYAMILSVYPNFLTSFWISLGVSSVLLTSMMNLISILLVGLICGILFYSTHLVYNAVKTFDKDYQPLIEVWSSNIKVYGFLLEKLLEDDFFYKITQIIKDFAPAEPLKKFLQKPENISSMKKILGLLQVIWKNDQVDASAKILAITMLSECVEQDNAVEHINHIWALWELLHNESSINLDFILLMFKNIKQLSPHIHQLKSFSRMPDILQMMVGKPELLPYFDDIQKTFSNDGIEIQAKSIRSLYQSFQNISRSSPDICVNSSESVVVIQPEIIILLQSHYEKNPHSFICLWDKLVHHQNLQWIEKLLLALQTEQQYILLKEPLKLLKITSIFSNFHLEDDTTQEAFIKRLTSLESSEIIEIFVLLDKMNFLNIGFIEKLLLKENLSASKILLEIYMKYLFDIHENSSSINQHLDKLLLHHDTLDQQLTELDKQGLVTEQNLALIVQHYLCPEKNLPFNQANPKIKKFNPLRKLQKILQGIPTKETGNDPKTVIVEVACAPISPMIVEEKEENSSSKRVEELRNAYKNWKLAKHATLFTAQTSAPIEKHLSSSRPSI